MVRGHDSNRPRDGDLRRMETSRVFQFPQNLSLKERLEAGALVGVSLRPKCTISAVQ